MCVCVCVWPKVMALRRHPYLFICLIIYLFIVLWVRASHWPEHHQPGKAETTGTYHHTQHFYLHKSELLQSSPGLQEVSVFKLSYLSGPEMVLLCTICCPPQWDFSFSSIFSSMVSSYSPYLSSVLRPFLSLSLWQPSSPSRNITLLYLCLFVE